MTEAHWKGLALEALKTAAAVQEGLSRRGHASVQVKDARGAFRQVGRQPSTLPSPSLPPSCLPFFPPPPTLLRPGAAREVTEGIAQSLTKIYFPRAILFLVKLFLVLARNKTSLTLVRKAEGREGRASQDEGSTEIFWTFFSPFLTRVICVVDIVPPVFLCL